MSSEAAIINWNLDVQKIQSRSKNLMEDCRNRSSQIIASKVLDKDVLVKLNELQRVFNNDLAFLELFDKVSPNKELRDACNEVLTDLNKFAIELKMDKGLFDVLQKTQNALKGTLDSESERFLERTVLEGKLDGLNLEEETRNKVKALKEKLSDLQIKFQKNCTEENVKLTFAPKDLDGVNEQLLNSLPKNESGQIIADLKYPTYFPVMKECKVPETRKQMLIAYYKKCVTENIPIFEEILCLRKELANLLGYKNFSEYALVLGCAKNPENVETFLDALAKKMKILQKQEMDVLLNYKKEECQKLNIPFDGKLEQYDLSYYVHMRETLEFKIDHEKLQQYFPLETVQTGIFKIYQTLLGLTFEEIQNPHVYHEDVKLYKAIDNETKQTIGYFYTDLHPREGKFGHAAIFGIEAGCLKADNTRQLPVCAMVCNFTKPTSDRPSLLTHDEVETFFHEFGHVTHQICTKVNYNKFSGTSVETDFVEAPSQMLENWCWEKESLKLMSGHYKDNSPIEDSLITDLIKSKNSASGTFNMRQLLFAKMDQKFHTSTEKCDTFQIYKDHLKEYMQFDLLEDSMNMVATFAHLVGGYESQYYSYLWSEVYSQDMFDAKFKKEGILNPKTGMEYRQKILEMGGSQDAKVMVSNFLGREPNEEAFLRSKGLQI